jgi:hypothetical protein
VKRPRPRPGPFHIRDLFLAYTERRARGVGMLDRRLTAKLTKLLAF